MEAVTKQPLKLMFRIPNMAHLTVIAGSLLLLAWSIDSLVRKDIDANLRALSEAEMANSTVLFQSTVLDSLSHVDQNFGIFVRQYIQKEDERFSKWKLKSLADQQIPIDMLKRQIEGLSLRANLYEAIFFNVGLTSKTRDLLYGSAASIFQVNQDVDKERQSYQQSVLSIAGPSPAAEPSDEQIDRMYDAGKKYFDGVSKSMMAVPSLAGNLQQGYNQAFEEVNAQLRKKRIISGFLGNVYIIAFILGSVISLYTGFIKA